MTCCVTSAGGSFESESRYNIGKIAHIAQQLITPNHMGTFSPIFGGNLIMGSPSGVFSEFSTVVVAARRVPLFFTGFQFILTRAQWDTFFPLNWGGWH